MANQPSRRDRTSRLGNRRVGHAKQDDSGISAIGFSPKWTNHPEVGAPHCQREGSAEPAISDDCYTRVRHGVHAGKIAVLGSEP